MVRPCWWRSRLDAGVLPVVAWDRRLTMSRNDAQERFASNLRRAREKTGMSQARLGLVAGLGSSEISRLEAAKREPRLTTMVCLARALHVELAELLDGVR
jgi:ribosome-binding protein aMBF1 (putative translation factor)